MPPIFLQLPRNTYLRIALDAICLLIVGLPILILYLVGKPVNRGFYCDDESIRYTFQESTITNNVLYSVGICVPTIVIVVTEVLHNFSGNGDKSILARQLYMKLGYFAFGAALSQLTTDIAKYSIGRLRPHFIDLCNPDVNCDLPEIKYKYIVQFRCLGKEGVYTDFNVKDMRLSFPSGHASFSAYCMLYTALYLQMRMTQKGSRLLRPFLQALLLWASFYTALSRISDYKHHWSDVLCGAIIGVTVALIVVFFLSDSFKPARKPEARNEFDNVNEDKPRQCS